jgi:hypothetical protein
LEGIVDGAPEKGGDVSHGFEGDGLGLTDGTDVTAVASASATAAGVTALDGAGRVVVEAVVGPGDGVGLAGRAILGDGLAPFSCHGLYRVRPSVLFSIRCSAVLEPSAALTRLER